MKIESTKLIHDLKVRTQNNTDQCEKLKNLTPSQLNWKADKKEWSILECIEHLNLYGDFYLPEITKCLTGAESGSKQYFKSGLIGNYFANSMLPKAKLNKMKTFKDKNPLGSKLDEEVLDRFLSQQANMMELLNLSLDVDLNKVKTSISISKWIKLKLGDTLRVVIYHNDRHMVQIANLRSRGANAS